MAFQAAEAEDTTIVDDLRSIIFLNNILIYLIFSFIILCIHIGSTYMVLWQLLWELNSFSLSIFFSLIYFFCPVCHTFLIILRKNSNFIYYKSLLYGITLYIITYMYYLSVILLCAIFYLQVHQ